jgi:phosphoglucosamine mutase
VVKENSPITSPLPYASILKISPENTRPLIELLPRKSWNISIGKKVPLAELPVLSAVIDGEREKMGKNGKIFVRYLGTEAKLRLLVEAEEEAFAENVLNVLRNSIENCNEIL